MSDLALAFFGIFFSCCLLVVTLFFRTVEGDQNYTNLHHQVNHIDMNNESRPGKDYLQLSLGNVNFDPEGPTVKDKKIWEIIPDDAVSKFIKEKNIEEFDPCSVFLQVKDLLLNRVRAVKFLLV